MELLVEFLTAFGFTALLSLLLYWDKQKYIISKGNELDILDFYEKSVKQYKRLDDFFEFRANLQSAWRFSLIVGLSGALFYTIVRLIFDFIQFIASESVDNSGMFSFKIYFVVITMQFIPLVWRIRKVKELIDHFDNVTTTKKNSQLNP